LSGYYEPVTDVGELHAGRACAAAQALLPTSDLNWLLHRAAQRFGEAMDAAAKRHGLGIRAQLVLSALVNEPGRTQLALAADLGLDKTTMTTVLDKLERDGHVVRRPDPADRRVRIPEITAAGHRLQQQVLPEVRGVEAELLALLTPQQQEDLRASLTRLATAPVDSGPPPGSCL
jgi:DNA-binding MarR family transcriptional regulator